MRGDLRAILDVLKDKDNDLCEIISLYDLSVDLKEHYRGQRIGIKYAIDIINKYLEVTRNE